MIELKNVTKKHEGGFTALEDVNLQINDGEFVFIVGGSGAGKSTLASLLIAESMPTEGTISVDGLELDAIKRGKIPFYRRKLGILFRDFRLFPDKTVYENVAFALRVVGEPSSSIRMKVNAALRMAELTDKGKCNIDQLSGLEQQKVALARALANGAGIILADEPCGNVDPIQSRELIELFCRIQGRYQKTVVLLTHDRELAESFGKRTVYLQRGKIVDDVAAYSADEEILAEEQRAEDETAPVEAVIPRQLDEFPAEVMIEVAVEEELSAPEDEPVAVEAPEKAVEEVVEEAVEATAEAAVEEAVEEAVEATAEEAVEEAAEESVEVAAEEAVEEAAAETVEETAEDTVESDEAPAAEVLATFTPAAPEEESAKEAAAPEETPADDATTVLQMPSWTEEKAADGDTMEVRSANVSTDALESVLAELFGGAGVSGVFDAPAESVTDEEEEKK